MDKKIGIILIGIIAIIGTFVAVQLIREEPEPEPEPEIPEIEANELTINIEGQGETDPIEGTHAYEVGEEVTITAESDEGWYFNKWTGYIEETEEEITVTMDEDKEVTAHFADEEITYYDLTINVEGEGETDPEEGTHTYEEDEEVTVTTTPEEDWYFNEWIGDCTGTTCTLIMDEDKEITAYFQEDAPDLDLSINVEGDGEVEIDPDKDEFEEGDQVTLTAIPSEYLGEKWLFEEWTGDYTGTEEEITITMEKHTQITAHFIEEDEEEDEEDEEEDDDEEPEIGYTITTNIEGEGEVETDPDQDKFEEDSRVSLIAHPSSGWEISHWSGDCSGTIDSCSMIMDENKSVTAHFQQETEEDEYNLVTYTEGEGSITIDPEQDVYEHGTEVTLIAEPAEGEEFLEWTGHAPEVDHVEEITITMDQDKWLEAYFTGGDY